MERRIEKKVSRTAEMICLARAVSFYENNYYYKTYDNYAPLIIPKILGFMFKNIIFRKLYRFGAPTGIYEYIVARTKYIDEIFKNLPQNIEQVLIFGAGFDTRAIRFIDNLKNKDVYELDSPITQNAKIRKLKSLKINLPPNLKFISIDFDKENLATKLEETGFKKNKTCLFILEGLTMYLNEESISKTFNTLLEYSGANSLFFFDYIYKSVLRQENLYYGERVIYQTVLKAKEKWNFGIEKGQSAQFLSRFNLDILNEADSNKLEERYFTDEKGRRIGKINGTHNLITAKLK